MKNIRKKSLPLLLVLILSLGILSACGSSSSGISQDEAQNIALEDCGLTESQVSSLRVSTEKDDDTAIEYYE
ncbi:MAG: hypothetical protein Q4C00_04245, partial [Bacillota bacterium]|nr:hypothetical protein [Bacillota bacterium]